MQLRAQGQVSLPFQGDGIQRALHGRGRTWAWSRVGFFERALVGIFPSLAGKVSSPPRGTYLPQKGRCAPSFGREESPNFLVAPSKGTVPSPKGMVAPSRGRKHPSLGPVAPSMGPVAPSRGTVAPLRGTALPQRGCNAPKRGREQKQRGRNQKKCGPEAAP